VNPDPCYWTHGLAFDGNHGIRHLFDQLTFLISAEDVFDKLNIN